MNNYFVDDGGCLEYQVLYVPPSFSFLSLSLSRSSFPYIHPSVDSIVSVCNKCARMHALISLQFSASLSRNSIRFLIWHLGVFVRTLMSLIGWNCNSSMVYKKSYKSPWSISAYAYVYFYLYIHLYTLDWRKNSLETEIKIRHFWEIKIEVEKVNHVILIIMCWHELHLNPLPHGIAIWTRNFSWFFALLWHKTQYFPKFFWSL